MKPGDGAASLHPAALELQAKNLVPVARVHADGVFEALRMRWSFSGGSEHSAWEVAITAAAVVAAGRGLQDVPIGAAQKEALAAVVFGKLNSEEREAYAESDELLEAMIALPTGQLSAEQQRKELASVLGIWIAQRLLQHAPSTAEEMQFAHACGAEVASFREWFHYGVNGSSR